MDYRSLKIEELVLEINKLTATGMSLASIEKQWGLRKKYISDKFRGKYMLDKDLNQYVPKGKLIVTDGYIVTAEADKRLVTNVVTSIVTKDKEQMIFKEDEIEIIYKLIEGYRVKQKLQCQDEESEDKSELANRNVRVYTKQYRRFSDWCKVNNVTQAEGLYQAIEMFMGK